MSLLCALGLHVWTKWHVWTLEESKNLAAPHLCPSNYYDRQARQCERCGLTETRKV